MPEPYSNDLRQKFFAVYDSGGRSLEEVAAQFRVSVSWAKKLSARRSKGGQIEIPQWRHGPESRVTPAIRGWMREQLRRQPDLTLQQLQKGVEQTHQLRLSLGWIWVLLRRWGLRHKKNRSARKNRTAARTSGAARHGGNS